MEELKFSFSKYLKAVLVFVVSPNCVWTNKNEQLSLLMSIPGQRGSMYDESVQLLSPNEFKCAAFTENFKHHQL